MMINKISGLTIFLFLALNPCNGQETALEKGMKAINADVIKAQTAFLASDWMEGREAGEKGEYMASDYIASLLQLYGVKPGGDNTGASGMIQTRRGMWDRYFQNFTLLKTTPGDDQTLRLTIQDGPAIRSVSFERNIDFYVRPGNKSIETEAPVVFAGYGFKSDKLGYNDFSGIDLKGRFILMISGVPRFARERLTPEEVTASVRETEKMLRENGIAGILEFNPSSLTVGIPSAPDFLNMSPAESRQRAGGRYTRYSFPGTADAEEVPRIIVSAKAAGQILAGSGITAEEYIRRSDTGKPPQLRAQGTKKIYLKTEVETKAVQVRNVIGVIEGKNPEQIIVLGAHYDHEGISGGYIWNGADDNASGTAGVLTLAKAIMESGKKPEKTIIIALWTAEEKGLLGSRYYVDNLTYPLEQLRLNLNFDMISRYVSDDQPDRVTMTYTSSCKEFREMTENNLKRYGINLDVVYDASENPTGGSDHRSFVSKGVPIMRFKPGHREEYHTPADEISTLDWDIMEKIIRISFANIWELANSDW